MKIITELTSFLNENFTRPTENITSGGKERIMFIDLAKGVCIIFVVLLHSEFLMYTPALKALRMPLYFILSGLFFKDYGSLVNLVVKKTNKLLIPFCSFFLIHIALSLPTTSHTEIFSKIITEISLPFREPNLINLPIWFLLCLFWVNIIYCVLSRNVANIWFRAALVFVIGCGGGYYVSAHNIYLPLFFASALSALPFFFIGICLRKLPVLYRTEHDRYYLSTFLLLAVAAAAYCVIMGTPFIEFRTNVYQGNIVEIYLVSVVLVIALLLICKAVEWLPLISYFGRYSVMVLCTHYIIRGCAYMSYYLYTGQCLSRMEFLVITVFSCWICIPFMKKYMPYTTAQKDLIKYTKSVSRTRIAARP
ncbi:MAG: acyltransferase [Muribaculaceae bacterium]|nr:acyltransferase [Muribaculaceae bacterium]